MPLSRLEQHMDSCYAARVLYAPGRITKAPVATGVTLAYVIHRSNPSDADASTHHDSTSDPDENCERVVLVTGYCNRQEEWAPTVDALLTRWQQVERERRTLEVLTLDNRGVGNSDAPWGAYSTSQMASDVLALADFIRWPTFHLVGASMGGMICQKAALLAPERIQSLALVATARSSVLPEASSWPTLLMMLTSGLNPDRMVDGIMSFLYPREFLDSRIDSDKTMRDVMFQYHSTVSMANGTPPVLGSLGQTVAVTRHHVTDDELHYLRDFGFPILVIGARQDQCINVSHALSLSELLASDHTELHVFEDAGHGLLLQHIDAAADRLLELIRRANVD